MSGQHVPNCLAHPNCLCHLTPIYESELKHDPDLTKVEENGDTWLEKQPLHVRQSILGVKGEKEWQEGRISWTEKAETITLPDLTDVGVMHLFTPMKYASLTEEDGLLSRKRTKFLN